MTEDKYALPEIFTKAPQIIQTLYHIHLVLLKLGAGSLSKVFLARDRFDELKTAALDYEPVKEGVQYFDAGKKYDDMKMESLLMWFLSIHPHEGPPTLVIAISALHRVVTMELHPKIGPHCIHAYDPVEGGVAGEGMTRGMVEDQSLEQLQRWMVDEDEARNRETEEIQGGGRPKSSECKLQGPCMKMTDCRACPYGNGMIA